VYNVIFDEWYDQVDIDGNLAEPAERRMYFKDKKKLPRKVAVSILVTQETGERSGFLDSAAALALSVNDAQSSFEIDLIAMVTKDVIQGRWVLEQAGYKVIEKEIPVKPEEIKNQELVKEMIKDGCCGMSELIKLWAWKMTEYDRVLLIDPDVHFHGNFDELFKFDVTLVWTHGALGGSEVMNGGFFVVRPNPSHFDDMIDIIKEGDFRENEGWRGKCCWTYGGRTIQGIVPMFYKYELEGDHWEVDRCKYNNMVEIDRCKTWEYERVTSNHFTVCQKPWSCISQGMKLCDAFQSKYWERMREVENKFGFQEKGECHNGKYHSLDWSSVKPKKSTPSPKKPTPSPKKSKPAPKKGDSAEKTKRSGGNDKGIPAPDKNDDKGKGLKAPAKKGKSSREEGEDMGELSLNPPEEPKKKSDKKNDSGDNQKGKNGKKKKII